MSNGQLLGVLWLWIIWSGVMVGVVVAAHRGWMIRPELSDAAVPQEFSKRYALGLWLGLLPAIGFFAGIYLGINVSEGAPYFFALAVVCFHCLFFYVAVLYRCPRCGTIPTSTIPGTTGIPFRPQRCNKCRGELLSVDRWMKK